MKLKILINLSTLKKGGGQTVGLNFISSLDDIKFKNIIFYFFVAAGSDCHHHLQAKKKKNFSVLPQNPIKRILFEFFISKRILRKEKIDIIYTYFGIGFFTKDIPQVSGSADSNLYFPEINFWSHYNGIERLKKKVIDSYRIWGLKRADAVIFENKAMQERSKTLYKLKKTKFIMPSINFNVDDIETNLFTCNKLKGLFLCGWQLNKNIMIVPEIAYNLKKLGVDFEFIITAPLDNSNEHRKFIKKVKFFNVDNYINLIGRVQKRDLAKLYSDIDFVFLLSKLESFSNNIIESWHYKRLLIISDEIWAKSICGDSAFYVKRNDPKLIAAEISKIIKNSKLYNSIIKKANKKLLSYPSINEKTMQEIEYLKEIYESN